MKIIGKTDNGFIVEVDKDEAYNIIGFYGKSQTGRVLDIGSEILVSKMYRRLYDIEARKSELASVSSTLRSIAGLLDGFNPVIASLSEVKEEM